jgi:hypothetical protein
VYLAERPGEGRVAVKELVFTLVPTAKQIDDFEREARLLASLDHPGIPRFLGHFREGAGVHLRLYNVQQYVEGTALDVLVAHAPLSPRDTRAIGRELLGILCYLHEREPVVVHRDVKPANVILREGKSGVALVDFGIAREVRAGGTHGATMVGTLGYMSPEQMGGSATASSDLYGVGATLLHLLTGRHPEDLISERLELKLDGLRLDPRWRAFLAKLLARRPKDRFGSAREALGALEAWRNPVPRAWIAVGVGAALLAAGAVWRVGGRLGPAPLARVTRPLGAPEVVASTANLPARGPPEVEGWVERLRRADSPSAQLSALMMAHHGSGQVGAAKAIPADLAAVVANAVREGSPALRRESLYLLAQAAVGGTAPLDAALQAMDSATNAADRAIALRAVEAQFRARPASAVTRERLAPLERLFFNERAEADPRFSTGRVLADLHPLPAPLLHRIQGMLRASSPAFSNLAWSILLSHWSDVPATEAEALELARSEFENERHLGLVILGKRFPGSAAAVKRIREIAKEDPEPGLRKDAQMLQKDLPTQTSGKDGASAR